MIVKMSENATVTMIKIIIILFNIIAVVIIGVMIMVININVSSEVHMIHWTKQFTQDATGSCKKESTLTPRLANLPLNAPRM